MRIPHPALRLAAVLAALALFVPAVLPARAEDAPLPVKKAAGSIELTDPVGDIEPLHGSGGKDYPGYDVVKMSLASDGKTLAISATLHDAPGRFASEVLELYFDTDNKAGTGAQMTFPAIGGFQCQAPPHARMPFNHQNPALTPGPS